MRCAVIGTRERNLSWRCAVSWCAATTMGVTEIGRLRDRTELESELNVPERGSWASQRFVILVSTQLPFSMFCIFYALTVTSFLSLYATLKFGTLAAASFQITELTVKRIWPVLA